MNKKYALVVSRFNEEITSKLKEGAYERLIERGILDEDIEVYDVPGAVEIPLMAKILAKTGHYHAILCLGAVIRGETSHYDYVCEQASQGCQNVMLDFEIPIVFGVLTCENMMQAYDRVGGHHGHKGREAADTAIDMTELMHRFRDVILHGR